MMKINRTKILKTFKHLIIYPFTHLIIYTKITVEPKQIIRLIGNNGRS